MQLSNPENGEVTGNTLYGSQANYTCDPGFTLIGGNMYRTCRCNGTWSGMEPTCEFELTSHTR